MCWRQRGGSVVLWRQTPLSSEPSSSCFCSAWTRRSVSFCSGFPGFDRLSLGLLELKLVLYGVFVSALHKAQHGPLTAAPCRQKFTRKTPLLDVGVTCEHQKLFLTGGSTLRRFSLLQLNQGPHHGRQRAARLSTLALVPVSELSPTVVAL